jgi:hypothetical protein
VDAPRQAGRERPVMSEEYSPDVQRLISKGDFAGASMNRDGMTFAAIDRIVREVYDCDHSFILPFHWPSKGVTIEQFVETMPLCALNGKPRTSDKSSANAMDSSAYNNAGSSIRVNTTTGTDAATSTAT